MSDLISRQAALDALGERPVVWSDNDDYTLGERNQYDMDRLAIETVPSAQPGQRNARVFQGIVVEYLSISAYPEYEEKPYFSIKYTENGQEFIGYGTYKPEVLSEYLKEYFMPPTQPECEDAVSREAVLDEIHRYMEERDYTIGLLDDNVCGLPPVTPKQPGWIPCSTALPEYDCEYLVTKKSFGWNCKEYIETDIARYEKKDGWHKAEQVLAWQLLPTPYREGGQDGKN